MTPGQLVRDVCMLAGPFQGTNLKINQLLMGLHLDMLRCAVSVPLPMAVIHTGLTRTQCTRTRVLPAQ